MVAVSLDSLRTPANGQILALKGPLSKAAIDHAFKTAAEKSSGRNIVKEVRQKGNITDGEFWASLISFPITDTPSFFPGTALKEHVYGFLLLLEVEVEGKWFLGVFKKSCSSISDWLDRRTKHLPRTKLTNAFAEGAAINRLNLRRMTVSQHELHGASYEAPDLRTSLPMMAASRCAIRSIRFNDDSYGSVSVTVSTSRVQRSGGRSTIEELADLVSTVAKETLKAKASAFLGTFAQEIPLGDLPAGVTPNSILFDWSYLFDTDEWELRRKPTDGELGRQISKRLLNRVLGETLPVGAQGATWQFAKASKPLGTFVPTASQYSIRAILENRLVIHDAQTAESISLVKWVRENDAYSITFNQPEYFFGNGALYHRADFGREVDAVRRCLQPEAELDNAASEKGKPKKADTQFPPDSIFGVSERALYQQRDWLCCADLGDEWADYLCIRGNALLFIHCKGGDETTGASSFQEVVGQGLKNLGRTRSTPKEFEAKLAATKKKRFWAGTKIERLRDAGREWEEFQTAVSTVLADPNAGREVHLVVTMLSKDGFEAAAAGAQPTPHFIQLVWLLVSFINSCREMGAKPVIVCKP